VVPVSGGFTARQATLLADLGSDVLIATPSYALAIAHAVGEAGIDPSSLRVRLGLFGGEPWTERLREEVQRALPIRAVNFYGLSEMCGPGVAAECLEEARGLHVQEDHFLVEVIDPESGEPVEAGEPGELVFTTLTKEALPLIRYRTGDLGSLLTEPCSCGRTFVRLAGLRGRRDDMLIVRGVNVYPSSVEHLLLGVPGIAPHYRLIVERHGALDELTLECEVPAGDRGASGDARQALRDHVGALLREHLGLRIDVSLLDPGALPRSDGKAIRVIDRRT
jgi:phenylacetate-CoA ligase